MPIAASKVRRCSWLSLVLPVVVLAGCGTADPQSDRDRSATTRVSSSAAPPSSARQPTADPATSAPTDQQSSSGSSTPADPSTAPAVALADQLAAEVTEPGAFTHLEALQRIADENDGQRAAPGSGYDATVDYVVGVLTAAGYEVSTPTYDLSERDGGGTLRNVVAQTRSGDPNSVVITGAHLDSVSDGPGIVDDGSGVATLLEIATRLGASAPVRHAVRFTFFGSEEDGAVGSTSYVRSLSAEDRSKILLYLNVDMVASPNAGYFVQGGVGNDTSESGPPGSGRVAEVLAEELAKTGVTPEFIEFVGDDESAFVEAGIPSGGAENGDSREKTDDQARAWGGEAGEDYDRCYHESCDTLDNVNRDVLDHYLRAVAGTLGYFATSDENLTG